MRKRTLDTANFAQEAKNWFSGISFDRKDKRREQKDVPLGAETKIPT